MLVLTVGYAFDVGNSQELRARIIHYNTVYYSDLVAITVFDFVEFFLLFCDNLYGVKTIHGRHWSQCNRKKRRFYLLKKNI